MGETITSTARVRTDRPGRYGKQLASHFGKRIKTDWDAYNARGELIFPAEEGTDLPPTTCDMIASDNVLMLSLAGTPEDVERYERVVAVHLIRFGTRDELDVSWSRSDGAGQSHYTHEDLES